MFLFQFLPSSTYEEVFGDDFSHHSLHGSIGDHAVPISSIERDPVSGRDAMSIVSEMAEQDHHQFMMNQPRGQNLHPHEVANHIPSGRTHENLVHEENMREFPTHVHGSGYDNQPSYHAAPYENKEISRYADVYKYDWKEYEKSQRESQLENNVHPVIASSMETSIPETTSVLVEDDNDLFMSRKMSSNRRSSLLEVSSEGSSSTEQKLKQQVPPPTSPTDSSVFVSSTTTTTSPTTTTRFPSSPGRQMIPRRLKIPAIIDDQIETTTLMPETTTTKASNEIPMNDNFSFDEVNTVSPLLLSSSVNRKRHPSIFNNVITFGRQQETTTAASITSKKLTVETSTEIPGPVKDEIVTASLIPSVVESDEFEVPTGTPPKFFGLDNTINSHDTTRTTKRNQEGVNGDEIVVETTTMTPSDIFMPVRQRSSSSIPLSHSSSLSSSVTNIPPRESIDQLIKATSLLKKPVGLFRNKLIERREQEKLTKKQEAVSLKDRKPIVIKFSG